HRRLRRCPQIRQTRHTLHLNSAYSLARSKFLRGSCPVGPGGGDVSGGSTRWWVLGGREKLMKYMILTYASQQDYDGMAGKDSGKKAWTPEVFAAMGAFMEKFNNELAESGELVETRALAAPVLTRRLGSK